MYARLAVLLVTLLATVKVKATCYSRQPFPNRDYSSYTVYQSPQQTVHQDNEPGCTAVSIFILARHNIRNPSANIFEKMRNKLPELRQKILSKQGLLCQEDRDGIRNWELRSNSHDLNTLTNDGYRDAYDLGVRFKSRFPGLLHTHTNDDFLFANIYQNHTWNTAVAFAHGVFNQTHMVTDSMTSGLDPKLLSFNSVCEKQQDRDDVDEELEEFMEQTQVVNMVDRINVRLGFRDREITFDDIDLMYDTCALEHALYRPRSPWCAVLTKADLNIMEFKSDLLHFQKYGPSDDINEEQTCVLMKKFVHSLDAKDGTLPKGVFYFADENAVLPFLTKLGIFSEEEELEGDSLDEAAEEEEGEGDGSAGGRKWRMSSLNPFGSNVAIVLYKCQQGYSIKALLNEKVILIPPCTTPLCPLDTMLKDLEDWADDCDFDDICDTAAATSVSTFLIAFTVIVTSFTKY